MNFPVSTYSSFSFPPEQYTPLMKYEGSHWWFRSRNLFIHWALVSHGSFAGNFLEIGCGTGFVTQYLEQTFSDITFLACDVHEESLAFASSRFSRTECFQLDATLMNFISSFDTIGCFDVLEHIIPDDIVLLNIYNALRPNGRLFLTVPQHNFLWSTTDTIAGHKRRYSKIDLILKLRQCGFKIKLATSFVSLLFPALVFVRLFARSPKYDAELEFNLHPLINIFLSKIMSFELFLLSIGIRFPFGGSLLLIAEKK